MPYLACYMTNTRQNYAKIPQAGRFSQKISPLEGGKRKKSPCLREKDVRILPEWGRKMRKNSLSEGGNGAEIGGGGAEIGEGVSKVGGAVAVAEVE